MAKYLKLSVDDKNAAVRFRFENRHRYGLREVAEIFNTSKSSLGRWCKTFYSRTHERRRQRNRMSSNSFVVAFIHSYLTDNPLHTLSQVSYSILEKLETRCSKWTVGRIVRRSKLLSKKKVYRQISKIYDREVVLSFCNRYKTVDEQRNLV
jgi:hypothetical protein